MINAVDDYMAATGERMNIVVKDACWSTMIHITLIQARLKYPKWWLKPPVAIFIGGMFLFSAVEGRFLEPG